MGLGFLSSSVKALTVNGVEANVENAINKSYPLSRGLNLYTAGEPTGEVKKFIDFCMSAEGQAIVQEVGFVPVN
ncbi:hypothetical protein [Salidesulfovibrio brasiliensis]|uniref:hypothetical protein n=1 Tax=Salidesulfovibrio brasiliensis TaxID=221711 RepID=UPI000B022AF2|nr:hypothetical protein [Salidesulfovibrio brasiliensis]